ncbi:MAG: XRE family transcriptional regulator [Endomicrobium sp.]|jgi:quercetin dioxygenase-like cupin family protein/DNA-binding XRE family transcriptional regulator|nr:XRE family transcriptional regulator [Endomicrobium sp.]
MPEELDQAGLRLKAVRESLALSVEDFAKSIHLDEKTYLDYENGVKEIPLGILHIISSKHNVEMTALITGEDPHLKHIEIVKKDKGLVIERRKEYNYQDLAAGFAHKKAEIFLVTVEPKKSEIKHAYSHTGQEFNYILEGTLKIVFEGKEYILEQGDSVYFNCGYCHTMIAVGGKHAKFLAVVFN